MGPYGYGGLAYSGLAGYPYAGVSAYSAPYLGYAAGYGVTNGANTASIAGLAPAAVPAVAGGYAGAGRYVANSAGVVHVAKRSADAEPKADADAYYYGIRIWSWLCWIWLWSWLCWIWLCCSLRLWCLPLCLRIWQVRSHRPPLRVAHQVQTQKLKSKQNIKFDIQCHYKSFVII